MNYFKLRSDDNEWDKLLNEIDVNHYSTKENAKIAIGMYRILFLAAGCEFPETWIEEVFDVD